MSSRRAERLSSSIHRGVARELQQLFPREHVTVSEVEITSDGKFAVIWISILNDAESEQLFARVIAHQGRLRSAVTKEAELRRVPQIELRHDRRAQRAQELDRLTRGDSA
ncbi:MAG: ribosome-binding factor A [Candidatus Saccharimonadales bacterium]